MKSNFQLNSYLDIVDGRSDPDLLNIDHYICHLHHHENKHDLFHSRPHKRPEVKKISRIRVDCYCMFFIIDTLSTITASFEAIFIKVQV
jgi:hypothetical protein